jgi:PTS system mannose-specific IIB component
MLNVVLVRIDDRLIHGQVMTGWVKTTQANRIIIIDDSICKDTFMRNVFEMAAPPGVKVDVYSIKEAMSELKKDSPSGEKVIILVKSPLILKPLVEGKLLNKEINIGGMGMGPGRERLYKNISVSQEERQCFKDFISSGIKVFIQIVPDDNKIAIERFLDKA